MQDSEPSTPNERRAVDRPFEASQESRAETWLANHPPGTGFVESAERFAAAVQRQRDNAGKNWWDSPAVEPEAEAEVEKPVDCQPPKPRRFKSMETVVDTWQDLDLTAKDFMVWVTLWRHADFQTNKLVKWDYRRIAAAVRMDERNLRRHIAALEKARCLKRRPGRKGFTTEYELTEPSPA
jgi:hypothetical protein